ncbi:TonB-dependent receptor [candidate division KSB1 bacterium]|nr:TonB-dependent receptor [candidate division KSB1 bacterium]
MNVRHIIQVCIFFCLFLAYFAFAANTGKIAGKVIDKDTKEPLIGANVFIKDTRLGAISDIEGRYVILQVEPGKYEVIVHLIGYKRMIIKDVYVRTDLTTKLDFQLETEVLKGQTVEIIYERPAVQKDVTSTRRSIGAEEIAETPGVKDLADIIRSESGLMINDVPEILEMEDGYAIDVRDPSLKSMNIRGSRGGDALVLIDGVPASHPLYGGYDVINLNVEDIKNVEIITGAFSAEYGQTQSAVINITTKSGGSKLKGAINWRTDELGLFGDSYNENRLSLSLNGPELLTSKLLPILGLKLPGRIFFWATATLDVSNTAYNNNRNRDPLLEFKLPGGKQWILLDERQDNKGNINFKLDYKISDLLKTTLTYRNSWTRWTNFEWLWKHYPDHSSKFSRDNEQLSLTVNHTISPRTFYNVNLGYTVVDYTKAFRGKTPDDFWVITEDTMYSSINPPTRDPLTGFYDASGYESDWVKEYNQLYSLKFDFTSQVHPVHLLQSGFYLDYKNLSNKDIYNGGVSLSPYGQFIYEGGDEVLPPQGPYKEYGSTRWVIDGKTYSGSAYITDKYELEGLIINAGLRADWFMPGYPTNEPGWKEQWEKTTGLKANWKKIRYQIDPRFGVSFPVSLNTVLYFSYGHFNKLPGLDSYLRDPYSGTFVGNPHLDYTKTVKYEFGFTHQFYKNWAIDIKNYNQETSGEVGTTRLKGEYGIPLQMFDNKGYSRSRGLEFELRKQTSHYFGGRVTYTVLWASGYSSSAFDDYRRSLTDMPNPIRERRLNWDVRHQVVFRGNITVDKGKHPTILGLKLPDDWLVSVISQFYSGRPYTPGTNSAIDQQILYNTKTGPLFSRTDVKFEKNINFKNIRFTLGLHADNIFNEYNTYVDRGFNEWYGKPFTYGQVVEDTDQLYNYYDMYVLLKPNRFGEGRRVTLVAEISW